jgi:hypothetical protein
VDGTYFGYQLSSWISPPVIAQAAEELHNDPTASNEIGILSTESLVLSDGFEAGFNILVELYLANFVIPEVLIILAQLYRKELPASVWDTIRNVRFSGQVSFAPKVGATHPGARVILEIRTKILEVRLLQWPLHMLADLVRELAQFWKRLAQSEATSGIHHEPLAEWELLAWIDMHIARFYGFKLVGEAGMVAPIFTAEGVGRTCIATGPLPADAIVLDLLRKVRSIRTRPRIADFYSEL